MFHQLFGKYTTIIGERAPIMFIHSDFLFMMIKFRDFKEKV